MRKLWILALKEVRLAFRDVGAILTMLATPLALTLAIAAAFGTGGNEALSDIPVLLINHDEGQMGDMLVEVFESDEVGDLVALEVVEDEAAARARVDADGVAALVVVPPDLSERVMPLGAAGASDQPDLEDLNAGDLTPEQQEELAASFFQATSEDAEPAVIEIYASADWRISAAVVRAIVSQFLERANMTSAGTSLAMERLVPLVLGSQLDDDISQEQQTALFTLGESIARGLAEPDTDEVSAIHVDVTSTTGRAFNWLDYSAASMAILFLMFAVTSGGRTLLTEREEGTLPRLLVSPTPALTVLVGKMAGVALTGVLQMAILWGATSLVGAYWGHPLPVVVAILGLVVCATGVGALVAAWAKTPGQANAIGTAVTLVAAALSGSFFPRANLPQWVQTISLVTPNAWGIEIFAGLQGGRGLVEILPMLGGMMLLTLVYYAVALVGFRRQFD